MRGKGENQTLQRGERESRDHRALQAGAAPSEDTAPTQPGLQTQRQVVGDQASLGLGGTLAPQTREVPSAPRT